jgi:hypothetical protein
MGLVRLIAVLITAGHTAVTPMAYGLSSLRTFEPAQAIMKELDIRFAVMYPPEEWTFAHLPWVIWKWRHC